MRRVLIVVAATAAGVLVSQVVCTLGVLVAIGVAVAQDHEDDDESELW